MPENDFLPVAIGGVPNVVNQATYAAAVETEQGYGNGEAPPAVLFNKMIRQASGIAAIVAQAICDITGRNMLDDGNSANQLAAFKAMLQQAGQIGYLTDTGAANAYVITPNPAIGAYAGGQSFFVIPAHTNNGASTINVNGLGAVPIVHNDGTAVKAGDIPANGGVQLIYQAALNKFILNSSTTQWGSGWFRVPNSPYIVQFVAFNIAIGNTANVPSPMTWGSATVSFQTTFPNSVNAIVGSVNVSTNTSAATVSFINNSTSSCSVIVADTSTTGFSQGWLIAIGT